MGWSELKIAALVRRRGFEPPRGFPPLAPEASASAVPPPPRQQVVKYRGQAGQPEDAAGRRPGQPRAAAAAASAIGSAVARRAFLSNFMVDVFGISARKRISSGSHHRATLSARKARI